MKNVWADRSHPAWVFVQQFVLRGGVALKFLLLARLLDPEAIGLVGIALIALSAAESLTDTGLVPAIVQHRAGLSQRQESAAWSILLLRGAFIAIIMFFTASYTATFLRAPSAVSLLSWAAMIPIFKNTVSLGLYYAQRERNFKTLALLHAISSFVDFVTLLLFLLAGFGAIAAIWASLFAEGARMLLSHKLFPVRVRISLSWHSISDLIRYGRWVWGSSALTFMLNQLDKIIITRYLGPVELGLYQVAYKFAQMGVADASQAIIQFLFPTFAAINRRSPTQARKYFFRSTAIIAGGSALIAGALIIGADNIFYFILGKEWISAVTLFRILVVSMAIGSIIGVVVVYLRAIGKPQFVTFSVTFQLIIQLVLSLWLVVWYSAIGVAWALVISTSTTLILLLYLTMGDKK